MGSTSDEEHRAGGDDPAMAVVAVLFRFDLDPLAGLDVPQRMAAALGEHQAVGLRALRRGLAGLEWGTGKPTPGVLLGVVSGRA